LAIGVAVAVSIAMLVFPPWVTCLYDVCSDSGYGPIYDPPGYGASIAYGRLVLQLAAWVVFAFSAYWWFFLKPTDRGPGSTT
jgi:hypothetical protein